MKKCLVVLTMFALATGTFAAPKDFKSFDKDGDGKLSKEEFTKGNEKKEKAFKKLDKDEDGSLSEDEFKAMKTKKKKEKKKDDK